MRPVPFNHRHGGAAWGYSFPVFRVFRGQIRTEKLMTEKSGRLADQEMAEPKFFVIFLSSISLSDFFMLLAFGGTRESSRGDETCSAESGGEGRCAIHHFLKGDMEIEGIGGCTDPGTRCIGAAMLPWASS